MTKEEIRQCAIECDGLYSTMCDICFDEDTGTCDCPYYSLATSCNCSTIFGYEHGFKDGFEEAKRLFCPVVPQ